MQGARSLSHTRSLPSFAPFKQSSIKSCRCTVRVRETALGTAAVGVASTKERQIAAGIQQEAPKGQQIVVGNSRRKYVPFRPDFYSSEPVQLGGSWDGWTSNINLPTDPATGEHGIVLELDAMHAELTYKYNVTGKWHLSHADAQAADAQGCVNNTTSGRKLVRFSFPAVFAGARRPAEQSVHLIGSFTGWQAVIPMTLGSDGAFHCDVSLPPGHHTFRFLINAQTSDSSVYEPMAHLVAGSAQYCVLSHLPLETLPSGVQVNSLRVPAPPVFKLMFHTHCSEAWIFYRHKGHEGGSMKRARMYHQQDCRGMMVVQLPAPGPDAALEFFIQAADWEAGTTLSTISSIDEAFGYDGKGHKGNGKGSSESMERHPSGKKHHTAAHPGAWRLRDDKLTLDQASQLPPLMLCTDLDGTLIEDQAEQNDWLRRNDEMTYQAGQHFAQYLAPAGGLIVYNTGRSIGMVEGLLAKKSGIMPWPAAIITAVGTKVFLYDVATRKWSPDPAYSALLDDGWNLQEVTRVGKDLMQRYHGAASCTDDGSEHPHRMSLQIRSDVLQDFLGKWSSGLTAAGVQHQMVASIGGEWRYVDCIAKNAGKGRAMVYLASKFGISLEDVVAAGDSGNDLLMLGKLHEGHHPAIVMSNSHPEVWDWLAGLTPEDRCWVYTPKAERAAGLVEGLKAILADKLVQQQERLQQQQRQQQKQLQQHSMPRQLRALPGSAEDAVLVQLVQYAGVMRGADAAPPCSFVVYPRGCDWLC